MPSLKTPGPVWLRRRGISRWRTCFFLLVASFGLTRAAALPAPVVLDLPLPANQATPSWLGHPETPPGDFASLNLPVLTPDSNASLLVTVYFTEKQGGFLRIIWNGTQGAQTLSDNFYENIAMTNQRSLLISPATLVGDGVLTFQCGDAALGIQRIKLEWLATKDSVVSPTVGDTLVAPGTLPPAASASVDGQPQPPQQGAWQNQLVTVPIQDDPMRVEQGVEFSIDLDKTPGSARLALKESGLALNRHLVAWINGERAGTVTPVVPDLLDSGYFADNSAADSYIGWRDGSLYVPVALLKPGTNTIQLADEPDLAPPTGTAANNAAAPPLAVKNMVLQLDFTPAPNLPGFLAPHLSLLPAAPIQPADNPGPIAPWKDDSTTPTENSTP